jgi:class 3 adenylate cyclase
MRERLDVMANGGGGTRASDAERQKVIELLRHHTGAGRLTLDEFADRAGDVYAAVTREDLAQVVVDLPDGVRPEVGPTAATATSASVSPSVGSVETRPRDAKRRRFVAIMGSAESRGRWRAPAEMSAFAFWGGVKLDLRSAMIESAVVDIRAWSIMGSVEVVVPPGIPVELHGLVVMGSSASRVRVEDPIPGAPLVRIHARGLWGSVLARNPRTRPSRRDRHRQHRHHRRELQQQLHTDVHRLVEDAIRGTVDRALGTGTVSDQIPDTGAARHPADTPVRTSGSPAGSDPSASAGGHGADVATGSPATKATTATTAPAATTPNGSTPLTGPVSANGSTVGLTTTPGPGGQTGSTSHAPRTGRIPSGTLTIMVSDIADSTRMTEQLGDQDWIKVLEAHNEIVRHQVAGHGGTEVKAQGDGFLFVFPSARAAVLAAIGVQRAMAGYRRDHPEVPLDLRVGLHTGEVVATDDDVIGHNVAVASRIAGVASPGEIFVSGLTRDLTASASDLAYDDGVDVELKGVSRQWRVHRVRWT